jgi:hypothetical protein
VQRAPNPSGLVDVVDLILDKGLVIDLYVRVSLVGIELLTIDARIVVASVDTYLRFAEAVGRLDLKGEDDSTTLPELVTDVSEGVAGTKTKGAIEGAKDKVSEFFSSDDDEAADEHRGADDEAADEDEDERPRRRRRVPEKRRASSGANGRRRRTAARARS